MRRIGVGGGRREDEEAEGRKVEEAQERISEWS